MKRALLGAILIFCAAWGASSIRWTFNDKPISIAWNRNGSKLEFGLRSDGVVVWREINTTTNSPSEKDWIYFNSIELTNCYWTNFTVPGQYQTLEIK